MIGFDVFDQCLDAAVVIDQERCIQYANEPFAVLSQTPLKRILNKQKLCSTVLEFSDRDLFWMPEGEWGKGGPTSFREVEFTALASRSSGRAMVSFTPLPESRWLVFIRDMGLEKTLHDKYRVELDQKQQALLELQKAHAELEKYSVGLEVKVAERTQEIQSFNQLLRALLDSLGQAFLVFDSEGKCLSAYSKACLDLFEANPNQKSVWEVIQAKGESPEVLKKWALELFRGRLSFEDLLDLAPQEVLHSQNKAVRLSFYKITTPDGPMSGVVAVGTDVTRELQAIEQADRERTLSRRIIRVAQTRVEAIRVLRECVKLGERNLSKDEDRLDLAIRVHTLKGAAGLFGFSEIQIALHEFEEQMEAQKKSENRTVLNLHLAEIKKLTLSTANGLVDIIGTEWLTTEVPREVDAQDISRFYERMRRDTSSDVQLAFSNLFIKVSAASLLKAYFAWIDEQARSMGKSAQLQLTEGADLRLDPESMRPLFESFIHLFRNSMDHGVELPEVRMGLSKSETATVSVRIRKDEKKNLIIHIEDDGAGIDPKQIREVLKELGQNGRDDLTDSEVIQWVLRPEFTTKKDVSLEAGRGVGANAVFVEVGKLGGSIVVESLLGSFTRFVITISSGSF